MGGTAIDRVEKVARRDHPEPCGGQDVDARHVAIERGETSGRTFTYWNAVTNIQTAGMWHGKAERYELPASEISRKGGCAVLLQAVAKDGGPGPILGAAVVRKPAT